MKPMTRLNLSLIIQNQANHQLNKQKYPKTLNKTEDKL
jgi:hypothetical protein